MVLAHFMGWRMKRIAALGVCVFLLGTLPAAAQSYPGEEVTVNPGAIGGGYLLYPGGKYGRHVGHLLQPGERRGPIRLHMPVRHAALPRKRHVAAAAPADSVTIPAPVESAAPPPRHVAHARPPARPVTPPPQATADISGMPEDSAARLVAGGTTPTPTPAPARPATPPPQKPAPAPPGAAGIPFTFGGPTAPAPTPAPASPPPRRVATATPPPARTTPPPAAGLKRASVIPFAAGESSPASADVNAIHTLATSLNAALNGGAQKVQLEAYGGPRGDKSSDSRRLSLKRALVVRELLIEDGVPSEKIDVRAMGGADDAGAADRVDVFVRS